MKIIKHLIGFILVLVLLLGLIVGGLVALTYDDTEIPLDLTAEPVIIDKEMSDDFKDSLGAIKTTNYETNQIKIDLTVAQINGLIVDLIRKQVNPSYKVQGGTDYIYQIGGMELESIYVEDRKDTLALRVHFNAFGFYKTTVTLAGEIKVDNNNLVVAFDEFKLGSRLGVKRGMALKLLQSLNLNLTESHGFNPSTMSFELSINELLRPQLEENKFLEILLSCGFTAGLDNGSLYIGINTNSLFDKGATIPVGLPLDINKKISDGKLEGRNVSFSISEAEINSIISENISGSLFNQQITMGDNQFNLRLEGLYYKLKEGKALTNLYIDEVKTSVAIDVSTQAIKKDGKVLLTIKPIGAKVGGYILESFDGLMPELSIDEAMLGLNSLAAIKNITIDRDNSKLDFVAELII